MREEEKIAKLLCMTFPEMFPEEGKNGKMIFVFYFDATTVGEIVFDYEANNSRITKNIDGVRNLLPKVPQSDNLHNERIAHDLTDIIYCGISYSCYVVFRGRNANKSITTQFYTYLVHPDGKELRLSKLAEKMLQKYIEKTSR